MVHFRKAAKAAGLWSSLKAENVTPHVLRHTTATQLAKSGAPIESISAILGHADIKITRAVYAKYSPSFFEKESVVLGDLLTPKLKALATVSEVPNIDENIWLNSRIVCICDRVPGTSGGWVMDGKGFQVWLSAARGLTRERREALAVLSGRSEGEASKAAIELGVDEARRCPHCASEGAVSRGMARGLRRYQCKGCGRTFNALTGTPLSGLHHKERWLSFGASLAKGETVKASAARCDVAVSTAFRWRHRFLAAARSDSEVLKGIVEADETYVLESRKGARGLERKARRRGGKAKKRGLSREQVPVLMAADRSGTTVSAVLPRVDAAALTAALDPVVAKDALLVSDGGASYPPCAAALGVSHEALNRTMGERVRGDLHVQTVNSRHSRLKDFLRPRRGIATRYLDNYLSWFHLVGLAPGANDRACLAAAVTR